MFHYKLDIRKEFIVEDDILINFRNIGSKMIFELDNKQQRELLNKLIQLGIVTEIDRYASLV